MAQTIEGGTPAVESDSPRAERPPAVQPRASRRAPWPIEFYRSAIGKKWVMAVSGIVLLGFVAAHMVGNLKFYLSKQEIDLYGEALRDIPGHLLPRTVLLWGIRIVLIAAFVFHIHAAYSLTRMNRRARPVGYQAPREYVAANFASRTMRWTGVIVAAFVAFHLADLTWGAANGSHFVRGDPYDNLIFSFRRPAVAALYVVANLALGVHIFHGAWSLFQSLGINNPRFNQARRRFAQGFAAVIVLGNVSFPIAVQAHLVTPKCPDQRPPTAACPASTGDSTAAAAPAKG
jgi:succinate dehydrogenase (or fumarate reductase) cytochrome b subunit, b558 family